MTNFKADSKDSIKVENDFNAAHTAQWDVSGRFNDLSLSILSDQADLFEQLNAHWDSLGIILNGHLPPPSITIVLVTDHIAETIEAQNYALEIDQGCIYPTENCILFISPIGEAAAITELSSCLINIRASHSTQLKHCAFLISLALSAALRRRHQFSLHASGLSDLNNDIRFLLVGDSGSGKSSLTMRLAAQGWRYLSDDALILEAKGEIVIASPLRRVFALTEQTLNACGLKPTYKNTGDKYVIAPDELFPGGQIERMEPNHLVFPVIKPQATSELKPLTQSNAMMRLLHKSPWAVYDPVTGEAHLKVLSRLAQSTQAWELHAGRDLLEQPERASELLGSLGS